MTTTTPPKSGNTTAFYVQAIAAFAIALGVVTVGQLYLPVPAWTRAFLALGTVFLVSSTFTLAKCVRDAQDAGSVVNRLDNARVERILAEYDPYRRTEWEQRPNQPVDNHFSAEV